MGKLFKLKNATENRNNGIFIQARIVILLNKYVDD